MANFLFRFKYNFLIPFLLFFKGHGRNRDENSNADQSTFFIIGSGRNGSTLLALLLNRHSNIFLPPEQYALPFMLIDRFLNPKADWSLFCEKSLNEFQTKNQNWILDHTDFQSIRNVSLDISSKQKCVSHLFVNTLRAYANKTDQSPNLFGDHSPHGTLYYRYLFKEFPNSKYVFLVRHPLDVMLSSFKIKGPETFDPKLAAWKWNNAIRAYETIRKRNPENVIVVKYEELVSETEETLISIFNFLDQASEPVQTKRDPSHDPMGVGDSEYHSNLVKPINTTSVGKWKTEMPSELVKTLKPKVISNARIFGYEFD